MSRSSILKRIQQNVAHNKETSNDLVAHSRFSDKLDKFIQMVTSIGGSVVELKEADINVYVQKTFPTAQHVVSILHEGTAVNASTQTYDQLDICILKGLFGVAENGAVWLTDVQMPDRVLPFITANLILVLSEKEIVHNMFEAYGKIADCSYEFGTFIAGPSKTADIEQSLVLGAHGAKTLTVLVTKD